MTTTNAPSPGTTTDASNAIQAGLEHQTVIITLEQINAIEAACDESCAKMHHLLAVVNLCAFASEARRILTAYDEFLAIHKEIEPVASRYVKHRTEWHEREDVAGMVLDKVSVDLAAARDEWSDATFLLRQLRGDMIRAGGKINGGRA